MIYLNKKIYDMRKLLLILALGFFSCNQKQLPSKKDVNSKRYSDQEKNDHNFEKKKELKIFSIDRVYDENDFDFSDVRINYGTDKFIIDSNFNKFIIDSTLDEDVVYKTLKDYILDEYTDDRRIIRISNYTFSLQKNNGFLNIGLFRRTESNKWKCKDLKVLETYSELGDYNYILGDNKVFSYTCETSKGHNCFAVVIDKVNSKGKYDRILKAVKFDLVNEKIIEIDLKKEKLECLPESGEE
ncbi:hypothetical protein [Flavobacterium lipolyticum]|uniref:Lipoprotein n=1 Tax=Flavobacterium lipolyticum TaxID=2893754 RepID=A0ABS8LV62_9FLAO|nr:hypothetical protein [Flavobacterium sp. F-126]MCC9016441.1 hypothetical protein [Flavobacterium sp. F-126]